MRIPLPPPVDPAPPPNFWWVIGFGAFVILFVILTCLSDMYRREY